MMTFGFSTLVDRLSWIVVLMLGAKVLATLLSLYYGKGFRDRSGWGSALWWTTKITPTVAVPCLIGIAWLEKMTDQIWIFVALMLFVIVAVPWKIRRRRDRMAARASAKLIKAV